MDSTSSLPALPVGRDWFISYLSNPETPVTELIAPYKTFDTKIRELFAQEPEHPALKDPLVNVVPVFGGHEAEVKIRARNLTAETQEEKDRYIMSLSDDDRMPNGSPAIVESIQEFQQNFNIFSELALADLDWSNVVVAGSAAVTPLIPVPEKYRGSKRALRQYYHEILAPASDVDLFLYDLDEEEAKEKIKQIETKVRDAILQETTTIRTKHAITIASSYPTRHIQIVLRIYKSVSEILTGFDVDCSGIAYDGNQIYAAPRALAAFMTQCNTIDLTRRSPSYENRLSKYSHRGFEVFWKNLDRSRIDPTIFERSFQRLEGLSRLLVLEKLPKAADRESYLQRRRKERGRPDLNTYYRRFTDFRGDIKAEFEDEVAEWVDQEEVSNYHTFTIPYGVKFNAKKIEKLLYTKDLLLNAEWNKPKDREVFLHRHPAFFGHATDVFNDCCGYCPKPSTPEEKEVAETESKIYVAGEISFLKDDAGRQSIGSFNPITDAEWCTAYVGNTARLCQAIVQEDLEHVEDWLKGADADPNQRDYTGRTPLQLAVTSSSPEIVNCLIKNGARLTARLVDGKTALHLAALRGDPNIVQLIMSKSEANEAEEELKAMRRKDAIAAPAKESQPPVEKNDESDAEEGSESSEEDPELVDAEDDSEDGMQSTCAGSFVKVGHGKDDGKGETLPEDEDENEPDFYDVNVVAWDTPCSPLHLAVVNGHVEVVKVLCQEFGADVLLPIKLLSDYDKSPRAAILTLVLALRLPLNRAKAMAQALLDLGATSSQADLKGVTAFHYYVNDGPSATQILLDNDQAAAMNALKHFVVSGNWNPATITPLLTAIQNRDAVTTLKLLDAGAQSQIEFGSWIKSAKLADGNRLKDDPEENMKLFQKGVDQPICVAVDAEQPEIVLELLKRGTDPNTLTKTAWEVIHNQYNRYGRKGETVLDLTQEKLMALRKFEAEEKDSLESNSPPEPLKDDDSYLSGLEEGTYKHFVASESLKIAKSSYKDDLKRYQEQVETAKNKPGTNEKQQAIVELIASFENLEKELLQKGAKTFKELYPDIVTNDSGNNGFKFEAPKSKPFEVAFQVFLGDLTNKTKDLYLDLFQAAWEGDTQTIKALTLSAQGQNKDEPPLQVAIRDGLRCSPFSIAVLRGHLDTALAILEIAQAQYDPPEKKGRERYSVNVQHSDDEDYDSDDSENSGGAPNIFREIIDDNFTIENVGEVSLQVKSKVTPLELLSWDSPIQIFMTGDEARLKLQCVSSSLTAYAIAKNDQKLLIYLINLGARYTAQKEEDSNASQYFSFNAEELEFALALGRTHLVSEILKRTGCGLPLEDLVKKSGVTVKEKPKYYQGLSIHGEKRADWAAAGRNMHVAQTGTKTSLALIAAHKGSIESVEFLLSDTPVRLYSEFAKAYENDKRLKHLSKASGGFGKAISKWLTTGSHLLLHSAILAPPFSTILTTRDTKKLIKYLIQTMPSSLDAKTIDGKTPLLLTFLIGDVLSAELLVAADADQNTRDIQSNNVIHSALTYIRSSSKKNLNVLNEMLNLLDPRLLNDLFLQRNSASYSHGATPLHNWIINSKFTEDNEYCKYHPELLKLLLKHSKGEELTMLNGAGDTPLHTLVADGNHTFVKMLLDFRPELLYGENATGRTPAEVAQDMCLATKFSEPPQLINTSYNGWGQQYNQQDIVNRPSETFVKEEKKDERNSAQKMWDLCKEYMERFPQKRRLVSLNEANEVAKRLGEITKNNQRARGRRVSDDEDEEEKEEEEQDPIQQWFNLAAKWAGNDDDDVMKEEKDEESD